MMERILKSEYFNSFYMYHYVSYIKQTTKSPPSTGSAFLSDC